MSDTPTSAPQPSPLALPGAWDAIADGYTEDLVPLFIRFSADALELAAVRDDMRVIDVACGPGTLALLASEHVESVVAVDFSETMIGMLRRRASETGASNAEVIVADGQHLPFDDASFDAAFSMFGLIFFPDRAAGLREMHRVLRRGARVVIGSWPPMDRVPLTAATFEAIGRMLPSMPRGGAFPLSSEEEIIGEVTAAGFRDVVVQTRSHGMTFATADEYWRWATRTSAPLELLRGRLDDAEWRRIGDGVVAHVREHFGDGPLEPEWTAYLAVGTK